MIVAAIERWTLQYVSGAPKIDGSSEARVSGPAVVIGVNGPVEVAEYRHLEGAVTALHEIADLEGDQGPGRIAREALQAMGIAHPEG